MRSESIEQLMLALSKAQGEFPLVAKNRKGYGHDYADIGETLLTIRDILKKNELAICHSELFEEGQHFLESFLFHSSGQFFSTKTVIEYNKDPNASERTRDGKEKRNNVAQAKGAALTYARRYAHYNLVNLGFGIEPEDQDDDAVKAYPQQESKPNTSLKLQQLQQLAKNNADKFQEILKRNGWKDVSSIPESDYDAVIKFLSPQTKSA